MVEQICYIAEEYNILLAYQIGAREKQLIEIALDLLVNQVQTV